uniref:AAA_12 domain-containing protein n=1 Tax=Strongyloides venezuelensis TaxID=75913 RepID=A0A0K0G397_STRVS
MYKAQINKVRRNVLDFIDKLGNYIDKCRHSKHKPKDYKKYLLIDTVDALQGHEKDFVIISTCRSLIRKKDIVTDFYYLSIRACIVLTRPKIRFFLFRGTSIMRTAPTWNTILTYEEDRNTIVKFFRNQLSRIFSTVGIDENFIQNHLNNFK